MVNPSLMPNRPLLLATAGLVVSLVATMTACSSSTPSTPTPPSGRDLITPAQALELVRQVDAKAVQANGSLNTSLQDTFETGPAGQADDAGYVAYRANRVTGLPPFTTSATKVYVPHQNAYPLQFLSSEVADGKTSTGSTFKSTSVSLFVKRTSEDAWQIYYEAYSNTPTDDLKVVSPPAFALDSDGFARTLPLSRSGFAVAPDHVAATVAGYMNDGTGPIAPGDFTSTFRDALVSGRTTETQQCSCHVSTHMDAAMYPAYAYQLQDGSALVFYAMLLTTGLTGGQFHSDGSGLGVLGPAKSGDYNSLSITTLEQQVAVVPASGNLTVLYAYEQQTTVTGGGETV